MAKSPDAFRTISEVADWLDVPTHVLRFWESRFTQVKPVKRAGGRRYYRPSDMELLGGIKRLLHDDGLTIRGVQKLLREEGVKHVARLSPALDGPAGGQGGTDNIVPLTPKSVDPDAALSRWPFVDDTPEPSSSPPDDVEPEHSASDAAPEPDPVASETMSEPAADDQEAPDTEFAGTGATASTDPDPTHSTTDQKIDVDAPGEIDSTRHPFSQPSVFDEDSVYFAGPLPITGLARLSPQAVWEHSELLEQALDRAQALACSMDRVDG